jgi:hypothetical protein
MSDRASFNRSRREVAPAADAAARPCGADRKLAVLPLPIGADDADDDSGILAHGSRTTSRVTWLFADGRFSGCSEREVGSDDGNEMRFAADIIIALAWRLRQQLKAAACRRPRQTKAAVTQVSRTSKAIPKTAITSRPASGAIVLF